MPVPPSPEAMKAVIPAAGLGLRFLPYTKAQPKEMIPIVDKPAIQYVVEEAAASGLLDILIITGRGKRAIEDHFDANLELENHLSRAGRSDLLASLGRLMEEVRIMYVRQPEPRGLGDAIRYAKPFVESEPFAVLLGDDITVGPKSCTQLLKDAHQELGGTVLALQQVPRDRIGRYGMVVGDEVEPGVVAVREIIEKPTAEEAKSTLATIGRYILMPSVFDHLQEVVPGRNAEVQLTDAIAAMLPTEGVHGVIFEGRRYDVGDRAGWLRANLELGMDRQELRKELEDILGERRSAKKGQMVHSHPRSPSRERRYRGHSRSSRPL